MLERTIVPYDHVLRALKRREAKTLSAARNRYKWAENKERSHHADDENRFVIWDGEGPHDTGYSLFGNSDGGEICHPHLTSVECLDFILEHKTANRKAIYLWFGMEYDVSMIFNDIPKRLARMLADGNRCVWGEYEINHVPHKWLTVKRGQISATLYDYQSFFQTSLVEALQKWNIGTPDERISIALDKDKRNEFLWRDIAEITRYFRLEMRMMLDLANELRRILEHDRFTPRSWHGPGALASMVLKQQSVFDAMCPTPDWLIDAVRRAFAGGHFELFLAGHFKRQVWNYDIHSAYPYYATFLPNLNKGTWRKGKRFEPGKFAVYHIEYNSADGDALSKYPLFYRSPFGEISWPHMVNGWYWSPEAELVADSPDAKFIEAWIFDEDDENDRPFAFLAEFYHRREVYARAGNAVEKAYKLIINAIYGQLARRVGWDKDARTAPKSHQLEWAGFITSSCRAAVYKAGIQAGDDLVSIDTDGIYSLRPINGLDIGPGLGQWEMSVYEDGAFQQSGVYALKTEKGWEKAKTRGIPRGKYDPEELVRCASRQETMVHYKDVFIGYRQALLGRWEDRNQWVKTPMEYKFGGDGKRQHYGSRKRNGCNVMCNNSIHFLGMNLIAIYGPGNVDPPKSAPHYLPWLENSVEMTFTKEAWFVMDEQDPEMEGIYEWMNQPTQWQNGWRQKSIRIRHRSGLATVAESLTTARTRLVSLVSGRTASHT